MSDDDMNRELGKLQGRFDAFDQRQLDQEVYIKNQFDHGRRRFDELEAKGAERAKIFDRHITGEEKAFAEFDKRLKLLELLKAQAEGFKVGFVFAIGTLITMVVGGAVWVAQKLNGGP